MSAVVLLVVCQVQISIEAKRLNPGEAMMVRFTIENLGDTTVEVDEPNDWSAGLEIRDAKERVLKDFGATGAKGKLKLDARAFTGRSVNVAGLIAGQEYEEGTWRLTWKHMGATAKAIEVLVVRNWLAKIDTTYGALTIEMLPDNAPANVMHFLKLVRSGFYTQKSFYRIIDGFMIQGGDAKDDAKKTRVRAEFTARKHAFGTLSMARAQEPDSASTEFFICLGAQPHLDGRYSIIGQLIDGEKTLRSIGSVKTDHSPCPGCGEKIEAPMDPRHCGTHHKDRPEVDVIIKGITLTERK